MPEKEGFYVVTYARFSLLRIAAIVRYGKLRSVVLGDSDECCRDNCSCYLITNT